METFEKDPALTSGDGPDLMTPSGAAEAAGLERAYTEAHANVNLSIAGLNFSPRRRVDPIRKTTHL